MSQLNTKTKARKNFARFHSFALIMPLFTLSSHTMSKNVAYHPRRACARRVAVVVQKSTHLYVTVSTVAVTMSRALV